MFLRSLLLVTAGSLLLCGETRQPRGYDITKEVTITGTVEAVKEMGWRGRGIHVMLKSAEGANEVHLGPKAFLEKEGLRLAKGDAIGITGAKMQGAVVARTVTHAGKTYILRDEKGFPRWGGVRKGR